MAILADISGISRATPALDSRAAHRGNSLGFPAFAASVAGSPSCSPPGKLGLNNTFAESGSAGGGETVAGSAGIDVAYSSSQGQGSSWLV
jgi:hypothetical protein